MSEEEIGWVTERLKQPWFLEMVKTICEDPDKAQQYSNLVTNEPKLTSQFLYLATNSTEKAKELFDSVQYDTNSLKKISLPLPPSNKVVEFKPIDKGGAQSATFTFKDDNVNYFAKVPMKNNPKSNGRMDREINALKTLKDVKGVPTLVNHGKTQVYNQEVPFIIMKGVQGVKLMEFKKTIEQSKIVEVGKTILLKLCDILKAAHQNNIYHRDIKPEHVFVENTSNGINVYLIDWGLGFINTQKTPKLTSVGEGVGTKLLKIDSLFIKDSPRGRLNSNNQTRQEFQQTSTMDTLYICSLFKYFFDEKWGLQCGQEISLGHVNSQRNLALVINYGLSIDNHFQTIDDLISAISNNEFDWKQYKDLNLDKVRTLFTKILTDMGFTEPRVVKFGGGSVHWKTPKLSRNNQPEYFTFGILPYAIFHDSIFFKLYLRERTNSQDDTKILSTSKFLLFPLIDIQNKTNNLKIEINNILDLSNLHQ